MSDKENTPVIIYNGAMYGATPPPSDTPTATIPCTLIGGSILFVLVVICALAFVGLQWLQQSGVVR